MARMYLGSFAEGFIKSFLAAQNLQMHRQYYQMRSQMYRTNMQMQGFDPEKNKWRNWSTGDYDMDNPDYKGMQDYIKSHRSSVVQPRSGGGRGGGESGRGVRNNNPGNVEDGPFAKSLPGYQGSDGRFAKFDTPENGLNALDKNLQAYGKQGIGTLNDVISKWAPAGENDPATYAKNVGDMTGIDPNAKIDLNDPAIRQKIGQGISSFENGIPYDQVSKVLKVGPPAQLSGATSKPIPDPTWLSHNAPANLRPKPQPQPQPTAIHTYPGGIPQTTPLPQQPAPQQPQQSQALPTTPGVATGDQPQMFASTGAPAGPTGFQQGGSVTVPSFFNLNYKRGGIVTRFQMGGPTEQHTVLDEMAGGGNFQQSQQMRGLWNTPYYADGGEVDQQSAIPQIPQPQSDFVSSDASVEGVRQQAAQGQQVAQADTSDSEYGQLGGDDIAQEEFQANYDENEIARMQDEGPAGGQVPFGMPQLTDNYGNLSRGVTDAVVAGAKSIVKDHSLQVAGGVPNETEAQNKNSFHGKDAAVHEKDMNKILDAVDPGKDLDSGTRNKAALECVHKYGLLTGHEEDSASACGSLLMGMRDEAAKHGDEGLEALRKGDKKAAVASFVQGMNLAPSELKWNAKVDDNGTVHGQITDMHGNLVWHGNVDDQRLLAIGTGLNSGIGFMSVVGRVINKYDPDGKPGQPDPKDSKDMQDEHEVQQRVQQAWSKYRDENGNPIINNGRNIAQHPDPPLYTGNTFIDKMQREQYHDDMESFQRYDQEAEQGFQGESAAIRVDVRAKRLQERQLAGEAFIQKGKNAAAGQREKEETQRMVDQERIKAFTTRQAEERTAQQPLDDKQIRSEFGRNPDTNEVTDETKGEQARLANAFAPGNTKGGALPIGVADQTFNSFFQQPERTRMAEALYNGRRYTHDAQAPAVADVITGIASGRYDIHAVPIIQKDMDGNKIKDPLGERYTVTAIRPTTKTSTTIVLPKQDLENLLTVKEAVSKRQPASQDIQDLSKQPDPLLGGIGAVQGAIPSMAQRFRPPPTSQTYQPIPGRPPHIAPPQQ